MTIPTWKPLLTQVASITNANPGVVTTTAPHGYFNGLEIRLSIPFIDGMQQINGQVFTITILSPTTFSLNADTSYCDPLVLNSTTQVPQVIPVGEVATTLKNVEKNTLIPIGGPSP